MELQDPNGNILTATARYSLESVVDGISIFEGKKHSKTLPQDVDARYLLGIIRNLSAKREGIEIARALWKNRVEARDMLSQLLDKKKQEILVFSDSKEQAYKFIDLALKSETRHEFLYWLNSASEYINFHKDKYSAYKLLTRRIMSTISVKKRKRLEAIRLLCEELIPLTTR